MTAITTSDDILAYLDRLETPDVSIRLIGDQLKAAGGPLASIGIAFTYSGKLRRLGLKRAINELRFDDRADELVTEMLASQEVLYLLLGRAIRDARRAWLAIGDPSLASEVLS